MAIKTGIYAGILEERRRSSEGKRRIVFGGEDANGASHKSAAVHVADIGKGNGRDQGQKGQQRREVGWRGENFTGFRQTGSFRRQRLGSANFTARPRQRTVPRNLCFHSKCHRKQTKAACQEKLGRGSLKFSHHREVNHAQLESLLRTSALAFIGKYIR
jgi:type II secretory pathway component PulJ